MNGKNFKYILKINNITQEEAAKMLNVTRSTIARWCKMDNVSDENYNKIIDVFNKNGINDLPNSIDGNTNNTIIGSTITTGNSNKISNNDFTSLIDLLKKKDEQIDKLIEVIGKLAEK